MIKVNDPLNSVELLPENGIVFKGKTRRWVRIAVRAPFATRLYYRHTYDNGDEKDIFLALVEGQETVEFVANGSFVLGCDSVCFLHFVDGDDIAMRYPDAESFTKVTEKRPRNPDVERLQHMYMQSEARRMKVHDRELARIREDYRLEREKFISDNNSRGHREAQPEPAKGQGNDPRNDQNPQTGGHENGRGEAGRNNSNRDPAETSGSSKGDAK